MFHKSSLVHIRVGFLTVCVQQSCIPLLLKQTFDLRGQARFSAMIWKCVQGVGGGGVHQFSYFLLASERKGSKRKGIVPKKSKFLP